MSVDSPPELVLLSELEQVLGEFKPGGTPKVFRQAGKQSPYVAVHEHSHRDLANNTAYGWTVQFLIAGEIGVDRAEQRRLARSLMQRSWHVFEGEACWMELWCVKRDHGLDAARRHYVELPPDYRDATDRLLSPAYLAEPLGVEVGSAVVSALAEFAMDQPIALMESSPADLIGLARLLRDSPHYPDSEIKNAADRLLPSAAAQSSDWLRRLSPHAVGHDRSNSAIKAYAEAFRENVQTVKDMLIAADTGMTSAARAIHGTAAMRDFIRSLHPALKSDDGAPDVVHLLDVPTRVENRPDTPVVVDRQVVPLERLKLALSARLFGCADMIAICSGHVRGALDPIMARLPPELAGEMAARQTQGEASRASPDGPEVHVEVTLMSVRIDERQGVRDIHLEAWEQFLSYVPERDGLAFWRWVADHGRGQCAWLSMAPQIYGQLVCPDYGAIDMPLLLSLSEHGTNMFTQIKGLVPKLDYFWRLALSDGFHAVAVGDIDGPGFLVLAPGGIAASERQAAPLGFSRGDVEPPPGLMRLVMGGVAITARSVRP